MGYEILLSLEGGYGMREDMRYCHVWDLVYGIGGWSMGWRGIRYC